MFEELIPDILYQSYLIEGDHNTVPETLISFLEKRGDILPQSVDVLFERYDSVSIAESAFIRNWNTERPVGEKKVCIIAAKSISFEAQNSLLKIIEEPAPHTHFFIIVPQSDMVLATLRSRMHILKIKKDTFKKDARTVEFLQANSKDRMDMIAKLIKTHEDDEGSASVRHDALLLLESLEAALAQEFYKNKADANVQFSLQEIQKCRHFIQTPGASVKMLLEHIALVI